MSMDVSPHYLAKFWFLSYGPKCSWKINLKNFFEASYLVKEVDDEVGFLYTNKHQYFL